MCKRDQAARRFGVVSFTDIPVSNNCASRRIIGFIYAPPTWLSRRSQPCGWLRTGAARRYTKVANAEALIWKILMIAEKKFRRLNSPELLEQVYNGPRFEDGIEVEEMSRKRRAA